MLLGMWDAARGEGFLLTLRRSLPPLWQGIVPAEVMVEEAQRIVGAADARSIPLRLFGGVGVRLHCNHSSMVTRLERSALGRGETSAQAFGDLDFACYWPYHRRVEETMASLGYPKRRPTLGDTQLRQIYFHPQGWFHVDVLYDALKMNHDVRFKGRLELHTPTLPATDLLLTKLQVVELTPKDLVDCALLLGAHPLGTRDGESIDARYIANRLMERWGFYHTATINLARIESFTRARLDEGDGDQVLARLQGLRGQVDRAVRFPAWRVRALLGTRVPWYRTVESGAAAVRGLWREERSEA
jgi:hypothetical protein